MVIYNTSGGGMGKIILKKFRNKNILKAYIKISTFKALISSDNEVHIILTDASLSRVAECVARHTSKFKPTSTWSLFPGSLGACPSSIPSQRQRGRQQLHRVQ